MNSMHLNPLRVTRRLKQFNLSLMAALAAMALTACGGAQPERVVATSSLAKGVQQILKSSAAKPTPGPRPA